MFTYEYFFSARLQLRHAGLHSCTNFAQQLFEFTLMHACTQGHDDSRQVFQSLSALITLYAAVVTITTLLCVLQTLSSQPLVI